MENQSTTNTPDISSTNPVAINQPLIPPQTKTNLMMPILVTFLVSAVLFGFGGYYLGKQSNINQPETIPSVSSSPASVTSSPTSSPSSTNDTSVC